MEPTMNWIDESIEKLENDWRQKSGKDLSFNNFFIDDVRTALTEAHTKGTQEALAKVEEWASEGKRFYEWAHQIATTPEQKAHYKENIEMSNKLLHHLQQLKEEKQV